MKAVHGRTHNRSKTKQIKMAVKTYTHTKKNYVNRNQIREHIHDLFCVSCMLVIIQHSVFGYIYTTAI